MVIEYNQYRMVQTPALRFDLRENYTGKNKDGEATEKYRVLGYDMRLESCIHYLIMNEMHNKSDEVSLRKFVSKYKDGISEIKKIIE